MTVIVLLVFLAVSALSLATPAAPVLASVPMDEQPPEALARSVTSKLLTPVQARRASGFTGTLQADLMAGEAGQSCYRGEATWTCDGWFTAERTSTAYPVGVSITVADSTDLARQALAALASKVSQRPGDRVLASAPGLLVSYETGLSVGVDLIPAVTVTVQRVQGLLIVMGSCQVEQRRLRLHELRTCAQRLQRAQGQRVATVA